VSPSVKVNVGIGIWPFTAIARFDLPEKFTMVSAMYKSYLTVRGGWSAAIVVMAVDNLPCELPRDSSDDFGKDLTERVIPHLLGDDKDKVIERATICKAGKLTEAYNYLKDYAY